MKVSGSAVLNAPVDQVYAAFNDPAVLARTLPGCQELREVGPDAYKMTITAGVASIKGTYEGDVALTQQNPPGSFVLQGRRRRRARHGQRRRRGHAGRLPHRRHAAAPTTPTPSSVASSAGSASGC